MMHLWNRKARVVMMLAVVVMTLTAAVASAQDAPVFDLDAILANAGGECQTPTGDPLIIGYAPDYSEVGGFADVPGSKAAQVMVDLINCAGGVDGTPVELIIRPADALDLELTLRAAQELVDAGAMAVLGPPFSDVGLPLLNVLGGQIPAIHVASTEAILADPSIYSFIMSFTDQVQGQAAGEWAYNNGYRTAVTFSSSDNPYFETTTAEFAAAFTALGGTLAGDYSFSVGDTDYSSQVNAVAALDPRPDVVYTANIMPFVATLVGQLRAAGLDDIQVVGADAFDATRIIDAGEVTDGAVYTTHSFPLEGSRLELFLAAYEAAQGAPLESTVSSLAADAVVTIAQAYLASGKQLDPLAIGEAMGTMETIQLITVESATYLTADGPVGSPLRNVFLVQNLDGVQTFVDQFIPGGAAE